MSSIYNTRKTCLRKVLYGKSLISLGFHEISTAQWMPGCHIFFCRASSYVSYSFFFELMKKYCICANADTSTSFRVVFFSHLLQEISLLLFPVFSLFFTLGTIPLGFPFLRKYTQWIGISFFTKLSIGFQNLQSIDHV